MAAQDVIDIKQLSSGGGGEGANGQEITVRVLSMEKPGSPIELRLHLDDRVAKLHALASARHTPPLAPGQHLKLLFCGRLLSDAKTLREEAMEDGCTVHAILSKSELYVDDRGGRSRRREEQGGSSSGGRRGLDALADMGFSEDDAAQMWALYRMETGLSSTVPDAPRDYEREEQWLRLAAGQRPERAPSRRQLSQRDTERAVQHLAMLFAALQQDEEVTEQLLAASRQQAQQQPSTPSRLRGFLETLAGFAVGFVLGVVSGFLLCEVRMTRQMQVGMLLGMACNLLLTYTIAGHAKPRTDDKPKP